MNRKVAFASDNISKGQEFLIIKENTLLNKSRAIECESAKKFSENYFNDSTTIIFGLWVYDNLQSDSLEKYIKTFVQSTPEKFSEEQIKILKNTSVAPKIKAE